MGTIRNGETGRFETNPRMEAPLESRSGKGFRASEAAPGPADSVDIRGGAQRVALPAPAAPPAAPAAPLGGQVLPYLTLTAGVAATVVASPAATVALSDADCLQSLKDLEAHGVEFHQKRSVYIPGLQDPTRKVDADAVMGQITRGHEQSVSVRPPQADLQPLRGRDDVSRLDAFYAGGDLRNLPDPSLASLLHDVEKEGYEIRQGATRDSTRLGAYGAFNALSGAVDPRAAHVWVWHEGAPLAPLPADANTRPAEIRDAIRRSREAYDTLQANSAGDASAKKDLELVKAAVGEEDLATRASVLARLREKAASYPSDPRVDYAVITRTLRPGEKLEDISRFFETLEEGSRSARDTHGAFNYTRNHLWHDPRRVDSFRTVHTATQDINATVRSMDVLSKPVTGESYDEREAALVEMAKHEKELLGRRGAVLLGEQVLKDYAYVAADVRPGESFGKVMNDWLSTVKGLNQREGPMSEAVPTFRHLRDRLQTSPERREVFLQVFAQTGTLDEATRTMEFLEKPVGHPDEAVRSKIMIGLLSSLHDSGLAQELFTHVGTSLQPGEDFEQGGQLVSDLMADVGFQRGSHSTEGVMKAWDYVRGPLASNPDATALFRKVLQAEKEYDHVLTAYPVLRPHVRSESEGERVDMYLELRESFDRRGETLEAYRLVALGLLPGETLQQGVEQLESLTRAVHNDSNDIDVLDAFKDLKARHASNPDEMRLFTRIVGGLESYKATTDARAALDRPVDSEVLSSRESAFFQLVDTDKRHGRSGREAIAEYTTVLEHRPGGESLAEATSRMAALLSAVRGEKASDQACDAFTFVTDSISNGPLAGRSPSEVTANLIETLLLNGDLDTAKNRVLSDPKKSGSVDRQEDYVVIGGIKVPVQKKDK